MTDFKYRNDFFYSFTHLAKKEKEALKILHGFTDQVIVSRREELLQQIDSKAEIMDHEDVGMKKKMALLDVLLQATIDGKPLSNQDIQEEVDTFMFEGHDTTTSAIIFGLYCLAKYPQVQDKLLTEIHEVIGEDKSIPNTLQKFNEMPYFDATVKEMLRLYSPVPFVARYMEEDLMIGEIYMQNNISLIIKLIVNISLYHPDKYTIPKGTNLVLALMFMHQDPDLYPEPKVFRPERFLGERTVENNNAYSFIPFR